MLALPEEIKHEIRVNENGQGTISIRGAARLLGIADNNIGKHFRCATFFTSKLAANLTEQGFEPATFISFGIPDTAFAVIVTYYAFEGNKKTQQAKQLHYAFQAIGIRTWMQQQTGWRNPQDTTPDYDKLLEIRKLEANIKDSELKLIAAKHTLMLSDSKQYRILVDGEPYNSVYLPAANTQTPEKVFVTESGQVVGKTARGYGLTGFMRAIGLNPDGKDSLKRRKHIKQLLKQYGVDFETGKGCEIAANLVENAVIPSDKFSELAVKIKEEYEKLDPNMGNQLLKSSTLSRVK